MEDTGILVPGENHRPAASYWQTLSHNIVSSTLHLSGIQTHNASGDRHWLYRPQQEVSVCSSYSVERMSDVKDYQESHNILVNHKIIKALEHVIIA